MSSHRRLTTILPQLWIKIPNHDTSLNQPVNSRYSLITIPISLPKNLTSPPPLPFHFQHPDIATRHTSRLVPKEQINNYSDHVQNASSLPFILRRRDGVCFAPPCNSVRALTGIQYSFIDTEANKLGQRSESRSC